jgi:hypothetical protein
MQTPKINITDSTLTVEIGESYASARLQDALALAKLIEGAALWASTTNETRVNGSEVHLPSDEVRVEVGTEAPLKKRRKSRKNVGNALTIWLRANPGWHSEEDLLKTVIEHRMSDAAPKRALKIALGRKRDEIFITDGLGNWRLKDERSSAREPNPRKEKAEARPRVSSDGRWSSSNAQEIARARRNLLGL